MYNQEWGGYLCKACELESFDRGLCLSLSSIGTAQ